MIYLVSNQQSLFDNSAYKTCSVFECLEEIKTWNKIQYDSETTGRDARLCNILCIQFGNKIKNIQYVIDITTIDILNFKEILETKLLIGHNLKFDLQFLYNYEIIPLNIWDTMIIEQLLHLGFDPKNIKYSLQEVAKRRLKRAENYLKKHDKSNFYNEVLQALWGYFSDKLSIPGASLTRSNIGAELSSYGVDKTLIERFIKILDTCEFARYAPVESSVAMDEIYQEASDAIGKMENILKSKK